MIGRKVQCPCGTSINMLPISLRVSREDHEKYDGWKYIDGKWHCPQCINKGNKARKQQQSKTE